MGGRGAIRRRLAAFRWLDPATPLDREEAMRDLESQCGDRARLVLTSSYDDRLTKAENAGSHSGRIDKTSSGRRVRVDGAVTTLPRRTPRVRFPALVQALRPHQWAKNLLLLIPLVMSHRGIDGSLVVRVLTAFVAFSLAASSVYVMNDLIDIPSDRRHRTKRRRPIASGRVSIAQGMSLAIGLLTTALLLSAAISAPFLWLVGLYIVMSSLYSIRIKRMLFLDVACLAGLYSLRLFAGAVVVGVTLSPWLMAFSMFFFLSLAFVKRYVELAGGGGISTGRLPGRGYGPADLDLIRSVGPTSGYLSVLVICLYIHDSASAEIYGHPGRLWWICPALLYWVSRVWFLAQRGELHEDPVLFAVRDRESLVTGMLTFSSFMAALL
jgi:4-hydroxybenzoate polyprenyltransferase